MSDITPNPARTSIWSSVFLTKNRDNRLPTGRSSNNSEEDDPEVRSVQLALDVWSPDQNLVEGREVHRHEDRNKDNRSRNGIAGESQRGDVISNGSWEGGGFVSRELDTGSSDFKPRQISTDGAPRKDVETEPIRNEGVGGQTPSPMEVKNIDKHLGLEKGKQPGEDWNSLSAPKSRVDQPSLFLNPYRVSTSTSTSSIALKPFNFCDACIRNDQQCYYLPGLAGEDGREICVQCRGMGRSCTVGGIPNPALASTSSTLDVNRSKSQSTSKGKGNRKSTLNSGAKNARQNDGNTSKAKARNKPKGKEKKKKADDRIEMGSDKTRKGRTDEGDGHGKKERQIDPSSANSCSASMSASIPFVSESHNLAVVPPLAAIALTTAVEGSEGGEMRAFVGQKGNDDGGVGMAVVEENLERDGVMESLSHGNDFNDDWDRMTSELMESALTRMISFPPIVSTASIPTSIPIPTLTPSSSITDPSIPPIPSALPEHLNHTLMTTSTAFFPSSNLSPLTNNITNFPNFPPNPRSDQFNTPFANPSNSKSPVAAASTSIFIPPGNDGIRSGPNANLSKGEEKGKDDAGVQRANSLYGCGRICSQLKLISGIGGSGVRPDNDSDNDGVESRTGKKRKTTQTPFTDRVAAILNLRPSSVRNRLKDVQLGHSLAWHLIEISDAICPRATTSQTFPLLNILHTSSSISPPPFSPFTSPLVRESWSASLIGNGARKAKSDVWKVGRERMNRKPRSRSRNRKEEEDIDLWDDPLRERKRQKMDVAMAETIADMHEETEVLEDTVRGNDHEYSTDGYHEEEEHGRSSICSEVLAAAMMAEGARFSHHSGIIGSHLSNTMPPTMLGDLRPFGIARSGVVDLLTERLLVVLEENGFIDVYEELEEGEKTDGKRKGRKRSLDEISIMLDIAGTLSIENYRESRQVFHAALTSYFRLLNEADPVTSMDLRNSFSQRFMSWDIELAHATGELPLITEEDIARYWDDSDLIPLRFFTTSDVLLKKDPVHVGKGAGKMLEMSPYPMSRMMLLTASTLPCLNISSIYRVIKSLWSQIDDFHSWFQAYRQIPKHLHHHGYRHPSYPFGPLVPPGLPFDSSADFNLNRRIENEDNFIIQEEIYHTWIIFVHARVVEIFEKFKSETRSRGVKDGEAKMAEELRRQSQKRFANSVREVAKIVRDKCLTKPLSNGLGNLIRRWLRYSISQLPDGVLIPCFREYIFLPDERTIQERVYDIQTFLDAVLPLAFIGHKGVKLTNELEMMLKKIRMEINMAALSSLQSLEYMVPKFLPSEPLNASPSPWDPFSNLLGKTDWWKLVVEKKDVSLDSKNIGPILVFEFTSTLFAPMAEPIYREGKKKNAKE